ncbi:MAG TPA: sugar ABC transporter ATP-binding protein [Pyrinomonadaceae bacterium]|nr:sugar ABC transporter ATP-binding protein [Pyrinomonadaceae bacterium]
MKSEAENEIILEARGIAKSFPGVKALDGVEIQVYRGKLTALLGENGAGKSTLMNILSGVFPPTSGKLFFEGREVSFANTKQSQDLGIGIVFQELNLFPYLTVAENIFLGSEPLNRFGLVDFKEMNRRAAELLQKFGLAIEPQTLMVNLRVGQRQMVEIAKVLSHKPRVVIMDEPTSALSESEIETLFGLINELKKDGVGIIYITHKLDELHRIGDNFTVFRDGKFVISGKLDEYKREDLVKFMVGRELGNFQKKTSRTQTEKVFRVENVSLKHPERQNEFLLKDVNFQVNKGEVVGIFGLIGAGRTEMLETIFGLHPKVSTADIFIEGKKVSFRNPQDAIFAGIGLVPEDRRKEGVVLQMSVGANASLASLEKAERFFYLSKSAEDKYVNEYCQRLRVKTPSLEQLIQNLSGGNQQKVILAKWLATKPKVLLLDEPTRGIDINAKHEIYEFINELAASGLGVVLVSSELPEILSLSDRIIVMCEGRKTAEFTHENATEELIMEAALPKRKTVTATK